MLIDTGFLKNTLIFSCSCLLGNGIGYKGIRKRYITKNKNVFRFDLKLKGIEILFLEYIIGKSQ